MPRRYVKFNGGAMPLVRAMPQMLWARAIPRPQPDLFQSLPGGKASALYLTAAAVSVLVS
jgi:hypothetical protein